MLTHCLFAIAMLWVDNVMLVVDDKTWLLISFFASWKKYYKTFWKYLCNVNVLYYTHLHYRDYRVESKKAFVHAWWWLAAHWALHVTCLSLYILLFLLLCSIVVVMNKTLTFLDYPCSRRFYTVVFVCFYVCTYLEPRSQSLPSSSLSWWYFAFGFLVLNKNSCRLNAFIDKNM